MSFVVHEGAKLHSGLTLVGTALSPAARASGFDQDDSFNGIANRGHAARLSEGLSQATLVMIGARDTGMIPSIATIRRRSKLC